MFRTKDTQPFTIGAVDGVVKVAEHVVAFNFSLENGTERRLAFKLVETTFHMSNGIPDSQAVTASDAMDCRRFDVGFANLFRFLVSAAVDRYALRFLRYRIQLLQFHKETMVF